MAASPKTETRPKHLKPFSTGEVGIAKQEFKEVVVHFISTEFAFIFFAGLQ